MKVIKKLLKIFLLMLLVFLIGVGVVGVLFIKDNGFSPNYLNFLEQESAKKGVLEEKVEEEVTKRVVVLEENAVIDVIETSRPAVVSIVSESVGVDPFRGIYQDSLGIGTGFIVEGNLVFTNRHVVDDESLSYQVVLNDGNTTYSVTEINKDPLNDFAILRIDSGEEELPYLTLGSSDELRVGQTVIAIGNALGEFSNTASKGIVSGVGRSIIAGGGPFGPAEMLDNVLQTDAALNPGNSGGPLLDLDGNVVGINVARVIDGDNIGFSIPINAVKGVYESFLVVGSIQRPFLGIQYQMNTNETSVLNRVPVGAVITEVLPDTAADKAGMQRFDVITEVDGQSINEENPLSRVIMSKNVGDTIKLIVDRDGEQLELEVTLESAENIQR